MKNKFLIVTVAFTVMALAACGGQPASNGSAPQPQNTSASGAAPGTTSVPVVTATGPLDPALATAAARDAAAHVYEGLVQLDKEGQPALALASDVTVSEDSLDYIFGLRAGVTFHDGTPLNADAVLANFNRWFDAQDSLHGPGSYSAWAASFGGFKGEKTADGKPKSEFDGIEKVDELTVLIHLNRPDPDLLKKLADTAFSIISPAALKAGGFGTQTGTDGGTGPYKIGAWNGSTLTLEPFAGYWNSSAIPTGKMDVNLGQ